MPITRVDRDPDAHTITVVAEYDVMIVVATFASTDAMRQVVDMGMEEGMRAAMGQIDDVLAEAA